MLCFPSHSQGKAQGRSRQEARRGKGCLRFGPQEGVSPSRPSIYLRAPPSRKPIRGCSPSPAQADPHASRYPKPMNSPCHQDRGQAKSEQRFQAHHPPALRLRHQRRQEGREWQALPPHPRQSPPPHQEVEAPLSPCSSEPCLGPSVVVLLSRAVQGRHSVLGTQG